MEPGEAGISAAAAWHEECASTPVAATLNTWLLRSLVRDLTRGHMPTCMREFCTFMPAYMNWRASSESQDAEHVLTGLRKARHYWKACSAVCILSNKHIVAPLIALRSPGFRLSFLFSRKTNNPWPRVCHWQAAVKLGS